MQRPMVGTLGRIACVALLPLAVVALPAVASAQRGVQSNGQRELFEWRGNVDQEIRIQMRGGRTALVPVGPRETTYNQTRALNAVPAADGYVSVQMLQGRGRADVVQQPSAQNGYTTVVRVRDAQGGAGPYDIAAYWQPTGNYGYGNAGYGNAGYGNTGNYGTYGAYGRPYPNGGTVQQPAYPGGKQLPGTTQSTGTVYGRYPYPAGSVQPRTTPNGKVLPGQAQAAHSRGRGHYKHDRDQNDRDHHDNHDD